jgi:hypothetical protein
MTSKPAVKPTYNPTSDELKSAISVAFKHEVSEKARFFCLRFTVYHHATFLRSVRLPKIYVESATFLSSSCALLLFHV